ncbi:YggT family protein [Ihubacter sp. rT4E-8]|uniref:YggT family protein n=1 Tax=unclassified Ihubacter TaxID=2633299 RepID=UPI003C7CBB6F
MIIILCRAIGWFANLITMALVLRAILSWFGQNPYSPLGKAYMVMARITEPVVAPCRMLLQKLNLNTGMLDFSVLLAFFLVEIVARVLIRILLIVAI